ncbi:DUF6153 family protein [Microbacterium sp. T2.11-28]|uniref:DUF6153 family protein n=1 Tax=Microbacterium sp. T2.11-28 TaxID=3041169 RepID=UPI00247799DA|nr:DUF6153 family protein [Microbacterium sp. T2.11-28]CAI9394136.1 hypothetical protein MICABA_02686 [Microbacterium sp. T2.11-28]
MNVIRSHARLSPGVRRLLLAAPIALAIITGLLSMHILTGSHQPALASETSAMSTHSPVGATRAADTSMTTAAAEAAGGHCQDGCGTPAGVPDHSVLMMVCVLALLAAAIVLLVPTFRGLFTRAVARARSQTRMLLAGLPHPRPPSLLVLSISRT